MNNGLKISLTSLCLMSLLISPQNQAHTETVTQTRSGSTSQQGEFVIAKIADGVYLHHSYLTVTDFGLVEANGLVVVQDKQAYIIDTPWTDSDTALLLQWITQQGFTPVSSISTHSHQDRAGGIGYLNNHGVQTIVSDRTQDILAVNNKPQASMAFKGSRYTIKSDLIEIYDLGAGHTKDNLVVWLPKQQMLFGGCLIKSLDSKTMGYIGEADMQAWPTTINKISQQFPNINLVIPVMVPVVTRHYSATPFN
ncbi:subclass B1 metallo-beta-lactamase [Shewanella sp. OMA3-2]|uniref:subclass B1 metallo-beta-lactamase n=1 Tax=Shewanella sp. OMA3-2 TaxID=2908650 RepID=UPI001F43094A|nr:subclass B1 metallo-beta-lactamase [Shewanella sp. OMA3-2]UJF22928.1 subclass B1 metallo-beta-lactamase [Shewanella sp. OMA3-2]